MSHPERQRRPAARQEPAPTVEHAAVEKNLTMKLLLNARFEEERAELAEQLRHKLNAR